MLKELLIQAVLILSVGVVLVTKNKHLTRHTGDSARKNLMVMRVGEVAHVEAPLGELDPDRDWIKLFFEER